jgi:hypothetical protein
MVDEHPVAGPDRRRDISQRAIPDTTSLKLDDDRFEKLLLSHAVECTIWYMYQLVHHADPDGVLEIMRTTFSAERVMAASADVIYHCIADYRDHHRPEGFLPPAFTDFVIDRGGVGAGTQAHWVVDAGGRRRAVSATITEPVPGRRLVETASGIETVFSVEPTEDGARVRFETTMDEGGLQGLLTRLFAARLILPIYHDELRRLEAYAQAHTPAPSASSSAGRSARRSPGAPGELVRVALP